MLLYPMPPVDLMSLVSQSSSASLSCASAAAAECQALKCAARDLCLCCSSPDGASSAPAPAAGVALKSVLAAAKNDGRLVCGVYTCGKTLEMNLDDVMMCILPETSDDEVTLRMHSILLEAFCLENNVRVVKVDCANKLHKLLTDASSKSVSCHDDSEDEGHDLKLSDCHCLLVMYPKEDSENGDELSKDEEAVLHFHELTADIYPQPVIDLVV